MFVSIVIDISCSNVDQMYEYMVPSVLEPFVEIGKRVKVNFNNKIVLGFILNVYNEQQYFQSEVKEILEVLDFKPVLSKEQIDLAWIIKEDCICPLIRIFNLMVPQALKLKSFKYIKINNRMNLTEEILTLFKNSEELDFNKIPSDLTNKIFKEIDNGNLIVVKDAKERKTTKYQKTYYVNDSEYNQNLTSLRGYDKREFLTRMLHNDPETIEDILEHYDITISQVRDLIKKGFLLEKKEVVSRIKERILNTNFVSSNIDSSNEIYNKLSSEKPLLFIPRNNQENENTLLDLTIKTLQQHKKVVIFVPEVLSTYKYASLIKKNLNVNCACINSCLSDAEYYDYYLSIIEDNYDVIVTSQKGIFLPYNNVGLYYLINEESDNYFSDQSPRFDIHQILILLSRTNKACLVLESLSPSVNSYCNWLKHYFELIDHSNKTLTRNVEIVNMIDELKSGNTSFISEKLLDDINNISNNSSMNHNLLLILNNKNYSSHVLCRECGYTPKCDRCGISLKYHEKGGYLLCPSCGKHYEFNNECPNCHSKQIIFGGIGIESLTENLDKIEKINQYHKWIIDDNNFELLNDIHNSFDEYPYNLVITTSALSRSMPTSFFDNVTIINFDSSLKNPSFDAGSKCYSLLSISESLLNSNGKMIIQTTNPTHYVIESFLNHDYISFIKQELEIRKLQNNVPFKRVNRIIIKAKFEEMFKIANTIKSSIMSLHDYNIFVLGPTYSKQEMGAVLIIKHNSNTINDVYKNIYQMYQNTDATIIFDKHPRSL